MNYLINMYCRFVVDIWTYAFHFDFSVYLKVAVGIATLTLAIIFIMLGRDGVDDEYDEPTMYLLIPPVVGGLAVIILVFITPILLTILPFVTFAVIFYKIGTLFPTEKKKAKLERLRNAEQYKVKEEDMNIVNDLRS